MKRINPGIQDLELYEFCYGMNTLLPEGDWASVELDETAAIEKLVNSRAFYDSIELKPRLNGQLVLDSQVQRLTNMLFVGLVTGKYPEEWIRQHFYFDIRGFFFLHRTHYLNAEGLAHFGGSPYRQFAKKQNRLERSQDIGYPEFKAANQDVDQFFIECTQKVVSEKGMPILIAIAGQTAAGKTEIVERLRLSFEQTGKSVTSIEMDNFFTDRNYREAKGIHSLGKAAIHFQLLMDSISEITHGRKISIPRYDSILATSSHDLDGNLKPGCAPVEIAPADIVFIEGNFPFLLEEVANLIGIKVVYLTGDDVRLKRKWRRDIDYRKKYELNYLRNRFFKEQFTMAETCFLPQILLCDILVDTSGAALWATPEIAQALAFV
ncbi:MAG: uridine kinase family protein [Omnitrophica WOR_2 bacterium]